MPLFMIKKDEEGNYDFNWYKDLNVQKLVLIELFSIFTLGLKTLLRNEEDAERVYTLQTE